MRTPSDLVGRSGDLKRALVDYAGQSRFRRPFRQAFESRFAGMDRVDDADYVNFLDAFILQHRLRDGRTVVEHFVEEHPDLSEEERELLLGWRDVVEGIFEVQRHEDEALVAVNLVDELAYRVRSNMGPSALRPMRLNSFLIARLVPIGDEWLLSGMSSVLPAAARDEALRLAAELATRHPALVFRNPEKLAQAWELQREERRHFIAFFGSDIVILPGHELAERMRAYLQFRMHEVPDAGGKSAAERARETYGVAPPALDFRLPSDLREAETVGVIYDEVEGLNFFANFGLLDAAFATPELLADRRYRQAVLGYLKDADLSPLPLRRLAERDLERASRVIQRALRRPDFRWERDGEALLRQYKPRYFERPALPSVTPLGNALARAHLAETAASRSRTGRRRSRREPRPRTKAPRRR